MHGSYPRYARASFSVYAALNFILVSGRLLQTAFHASDASMSPRTQHLPRRRVMNSFSVTAVGNLAKNPELSVKGDTTYTRICLVGNDYAGKDDHGNAREAVTSLWFVAFEGVG